ncbi:MAG TPA: hypothetical protein VGF84_00475 [Micromonosporaceae bacterium]
MIDGIDPVGLVRRFEPVLRFTAGELFFPLPVENYLADAALWASPATRHGEAALLVDHGQLDPARLVTEALAHPEVDLFLRYARRSLQRRELRLWRRRSDRPAFTGVSRLAAVGMLGRIIDSGMRLSLMLRGKVPGGLTAAAERQYGATAPPDAYHAHVSTDGGYVVIQYWFLYAMNDWRSTFGGVNDHEADWEQVTLYLAPEGDEWEIAWLAFSSHDETGDELRRRPDDPDIEWVDGTHPVVYAGAGSHSGAYLPGDYLVRVQPPALARAITGWTSMRSTLFPWTRGRPVQGVGIPYVDYRRGDGVGIGPGTDRPWTPIVIDEDTPWVRDFRGLWGLDTADPFGGERAPAGPRYERSGAIRASWGDPVGWAGLDKVPPTVAGVALARADRIGELDALIDDLGTRIEADQDGLRRAATGVTALPPSANASRRRDGPVERLVARESEVADLRTLRRDAINERDRLRQVSGDVHDLPPHAHLRHRAVPDTASSANALLRFWSGASLSVLLILLGLSLVLNRRPVLWAIVLAVVLVMAVEALLRRRLLAFLAAVTVTAATVVLVWLLITNLRVAVGVLALVGAVAIGVANLRAFLAQR